VIYRLGKAIRIVAWDFAAGLEQHLGCRIALTPAVKPWSLTGTETYSMEMQHVIATVAVTLLLTANVLAQDRCEGLVQVDYGDWSIIIDKRGSFVCEFETYSKIGDQILAVCPDSSMCSVFLPLRGDPGAIIEHGSMKTIVELRTIQTHREVDCTHIDEASSFVLRRP
jgi:hypothetical protein